MNSGLVIKNYIEHQTNTKPIGLVLTERESVINMTILLGLKYDTKNSSSLQALFRRDDTILQ